MSSSNATIPVGAGRHRYDVLERFASLPTGVRLVECAGVAVGSGDRVFVLNRGDHPVVILEGATGKYVSSWGSGMFARPHGICVGPDDSVFVVDDHGHVVHKLSPEGALLMTIGVRGQPSDTGCVGMDSFTVKRASGPFHCPTNLAVAPDGSLYVSDGYGNARVHHFIAEGALVSSWGEPGEAPGRFRLPHGIALDRLGRVYVADRENNRVQVFSPSGDFLCQWRGCSRPCHIWVDGEDVAYVAELTPPGGRVSVFGPEGELVTRWEPGGQERRAGAHGICGDRQGNLYVGFVLQGAELNDRVLLKYQRLTGA